MGRWPEAPQTVHHKFTTSFVDFNLQGNSSPRSKFDDLGLQDQSALQPEAQHGAHLMESLPAGGARIQVESTPGGVLLDHEQVGVPTDEQIRPVRIQSAPNSFGIAAGPSSDVRHPNAAAAALKMLVFGKITSQQLVVNVAVDDHEWSHFCQGIGNADMPDVPRMPDFIALRKVMQDPVIDVTMGVADESDAHGAKLGMDARTAPSWRLRSRHMTNKTTWWSVMLLLCVGWGTVHAQPGARLHSDNKKAVKAYRKAVETAREAMAPGADKAALQQEVEDGLLKAVALDPGFSEAERLLAGMRFEQGAYEEALALYHRYLTRDGQDWIRDHFGWARAARYALDPAAMEQAMEAMLAIPGVLEGPDTARIGSVLADAAFMAEALAHPVNVKPAALPPAISTLQDEYFPSLWLAGDGLIFTRRVEDVRFRHGQEDLYISTRNGDMWSEAEPLRGLNTGNNEGAASLSGDGNTLCYTMCRDADRPGEGDHRGSCDLYVSRRDAHGRWQRPVNLGAVNTGGWESQPCLSPDGRMLFFTRGRGRPGQRQHDLYMAQTGVDGRFTDARPLPDGINTAGQEMRPFLHPDGRHLYFASDGHPGMGGLDLFVCEMGPDGAWGEPVNLGYPLNTPEDESGMVVASDGRTGYFARSLDGQLDVHVFDVPESAQADPTAALEGRIAALDGTGLPQGVVRLLDGVTGEAFAVGRTGADGQYHIPIPTDRDFVLLAEAPGHLLESVRVQAGEWTGRSRRDFQLSPLEENAEVVLRNVFFETGSAALSAASEPELREVALWLASNPRIRLEVGGHTDDVGLAKDNEELSRQRAEAVLDFLERHGAVEGQLTAVGYGQSRPAVPGQTEEARRQNRRTSLRVLGMD